MTERETPALLTPNPMIADHSRPGIEPVATYAAPPSGWCRQDDTGVHNAVRIQRRFDRTDGRQLCRFAISCEILDFEAPDAVFGADRAAHLVSDIVDRGLDDLLLSSVIFA